MFGSLIDSLWDGVEGVFDLIKDIVDSVLDLISTIISGIGSALSSIGSAIARFGGWIVVIIIVLIILVLMPYTGPVILEALGSVFAVSTTSALAANLAVLAVAVTFVAYALDPDEFIKGLEEATDAIVSPVVSIVGGVISGAVDLATEVISDVADATGLSSVFKFIVFGGVAYFGFKLLSNNKEQKSDG